MSAVRPDDDTHPEARAVQLRLLRRATVARRAELACSLSATAIALSRRALAERMPGATPEQVLLRWVAQNYGEDLARRVARRLAVAS